MAKILGSSLLGALVGGATPLGVIGAIGGAGIAAGQAGAAGLEGEEAKEVRQAGLLGAGKGALSGAGAGAAAGSALGPVGAAVGGVGGALVGGVAGGTTGAKQSREAIDLEKEQAKLIKQAQSESERLAAAQRGAAELATGRGAGVVTAPTADDMVLMSAVSPSGGSAFDRWHAQVFGP